MARPEADYVTPRQVALAVLCLVTLILALCAAAAVGWVYFGTPTP
jgi:hypothetical protein